MWPLLQKLLGSNKNQRVKLLDDIKTISGLSDEIEKKRAKLYSTEYNALLEKKREVFISLGDFLDMMEIPNLSMQDIVKRCKHVSELDRHSSIVELYSITEDGHIVLCSDVHTCEKHKAYTGKKIRIATIRSTS